MEGPKTKNQNLAYLYLISGELSKVWVAWDKLPYMRNEFSNIKGFDQKADTFFHVPNVY